MAALPSLPWWAFALAMATALGVALAVDHWLGEPPVRWHPVVWIGNYLGWAGRRVAPPMGAVASQAGSFVAGALAWCVGAAVVVGVAIALQAALWRLPFWLAVPLLGLLLKPLLAWRMLRSEVLSVEAALGMSLDAGRARLAHLVSRDVQALGEAEVRESAIESLAENLNDSVVAPILWFVLFGLPGAALYRFANTADAMWGYRGERGGRDWTWAGKWAARADDVFSWLPARLTALLLWADPAGARPAMAMLRIEARRTPSPNSGWPMAAMALRLGIRLGKPGVYTLHTAGRVPVPADTLSAVARGERAVRVLALCAAPVLGLVARWAA